jgi:hypothetical protein
VPSREGRNFFLLGDLLLRNSRDMYKRVWKQATLSIGAPFGEPGGDSFSGTFERLMKEGSGNGTSLFKLIWAPFLIQIMLGAEGEGSLELL